MARTSVSARLDRRRPRNIYRATCVPFGLLYLIDRVGEPCSFLFSDSASRVGDYHRFRFASLPQNTDSLWGSRTVLMDRCSCLSSVQKKSFSGDANRLPTEGGIVGLSKRRITDTAIQQAVKACSGSRRGTSPSLGGGEYIPLFLTHPPAAPKVSTARTPTKGPRSQPFSADADRSNLSVSSA